MENLKRKIALAREVIPYHRCTIDLTTGNQDLCLNEAGSIIYVEKAEGEAYAKFNNSWSDPILLTEGLIVKIPFERVYISNPPQAGKKIELIIGIADFFRPCLRTAKAKGGATTFLELADTPSSYSGQASKLVGVKATEDGLEFTTPTAPPTTFLDLTDTPSSYLGQASKIVRVKTTEDGLEFTPPPATTFLELTDTPSSYTGEANKFVKVKATEDGLEFAPAPTGGATTFLELTDTPSSYSGEANKFVKVKTTEDGLEFTPPPIYDPWARKFLNTIFGLKEYDTSSSGDASITVNKATYFTLNSGTATGQYICVGFYTPNKLNQNQELETTVRAAPNLPANSYALVAGIYRTITVYNPYAALSGAGVWALNDSNYSGTYLIVHKAAYGRDMAQISTSLPAGGDVYRVEWTSEKVRAYKNGVLAAELNQYSGNITAFFALYDLSVYGATATGASCSWASLRSYCNY